MTKPYTVLELFNDFHNTTARVKVPANGRITKFQIRNANATLCGVQDCLCSGPMGTRSSKTPEIDWEHESRTGKITGAYIAICDKTRGEHDR